ncbi:hypothetical protein P4449_27320 [Cytobacillus praedii]|nr:hypothetical protein [Cytobacillus praedii]
MLNREKPPIMGVWNGVGGKFEKGETSDEVHCEKCLRKQGLEWKSIDWILNPNNLGIAEKVSQYLPVLLNKADNYSLKYQDGQIYIL